MEDLLVDTPWTPSPELCDTFLDELVMDLGRGVAQDVHAQTHALASPRALPCQRCGEYCSSFISPLPTSSSRSILPSNGPQRGELFAVGDIYGHIPSRMDAKVACPVCSVALPTARFAPHLEKCLGGGRASRRTRAPTTTTVNNPNGKANGKKSNVSDDPFSSFSADPSSSHLDGNTPAHPNETELFGDILFY